MGVLSLPSGRIALVFAILSTSSEAASSLLATGGGGSSQNASFSSNTALAGQTVLSATSSSLATSSTAGIGDYVASALGISSTSLSSTLASTTSSYTSTNASSSASLNAAVTASATLSNTTHLSNTTLGVCYDQWMSYWNSSSSYRGNSTVTIFPTFTSTTWSGLTTEADAWTITGGTYTTTYDITQTITVSAGAFNYSVITETYSGIQTYTVTESSSATTETWTDHSYTESTATVPQVVTITPPPCRLPDTVPQCQSSWMSYLSASTNYNPPVCQSASIDSNLCQSFQDKYVVDNKWLDSAQFDGYSKGYTQNPDYVVNGTAVTGGVQQWIWPTWSTLAPSCTLGCARCGITGGHVQLMYWPPNTSYNTETGPVTMSVDNTTLTYPTVYVSYSGVYASDSCKAVGPTVTSTIVAISNSKAISSIYAQPAEGAQFDIVAFDVVTTQVASFNLADLIDTPASVFSRQIWCVSLMSMHAAGYENGSYYTVAANNDYGAHIPVQYSCPTTLPYNPILYLPSEVLQSMHPDWATCSGDINGVYDPPTALQQQATEEGVTTAKPLTTTPASPSSTIQAPTVSATPTITTAQATTSAQPVVVGSGSTPTQTSATAKASPPVQVGSSGSSTADPQQPVVSSASSGQSAASSIQDPTASPSSNKVDPGVLLSIVSQVGGSSASNDPPKATTTTNALSVLQSAADPTSTITHDGSHGALSGQPSGNAATSNVDPGNSKTAQPQAVSVGSQALSVVNVDPSHVAVQNGDVFAPLAVGGAATTVDGHTISAAPSGNLVVAGASGQSTIVISSAGPKAPAATSIDVGGQTFVASNADPSHVVIQNSGTVVTLAFGGAATTINGQILGAAASGHLVLSGSAGLSTIELPSQTNNDPAHPTAITTIKASNGAVLSVATMQSGVEVWDGSTTIMLTPGAATMVDGQTISVRRSHSDVVVVGSSRITLGNGTAIRTGSAASTTKSPSTIGLAATNSGVSSTTSATATSVSIAAGQKVSCEVLCIIGLSLALIGLIA